MYVYSCINVYIYIYIQTHACMQTPLHQLIYI